MNSNCSKIFDLLFSTAHRCLSMPLLMTLLLVCSERALSFDFDAEAPESFKYPINDTSMVPYVNPSSHSFSAITEGKAVVAKGAATYSIPIVLPPSARNFQPKVALVYNSMNKKRGVMGKGWSISGSSYIKRCKKTYSQEESEAQKSNPRYTKADRLCLDGKKLVLANGPKDATDSQYWASGAEYRTEIESFIKVKAVGNVNGGHSYFEVYLKNSEIRYYGRQQDGQNSRFHKGGSTPIKTWALDHAEDRYQNDYKIFYEKSGTDEDYVISHITYAPDAYIEFNYSNAKQYAGRDYDAGYEYQHSQLLENVTTYIGTTGSPDQPVQKYKIRYRSSATTNHDVVDEVQRCGFNIRGFYEKCGRPLSFEWTESESGFEEVGDTAKLCSNNTPIHATQVVDINDDGINDILYGENIRNITRQSVGTLWRLALGTEAGCYTAQNWVTDWAVRFAWGAVKPIRTRAGMALLVTRFKVGNNLTKYYDIDIAFPNFQTQSFIGANLAVVTSATGSITVADFNNDGFDDFVFGNCRSFNISQAPECRFGDFLTDQSAITFLQNPNPTSAANVFTRQNSTYVRMNTPTAGTTVMDWDSDGLKDVVSVYSPKNAITTSAQFSKNYGGTSVSNYPFDFRQMSDATLFKGGILSQTDEVFLYSVLNARNQPSPMHNAYPDLNGDGLKDIAFHRNGYWQVAFNTGDGFTDNIQTNASAGDEKNQYFFSYDYNKDGYDDLLVQYKVGHKNFRWKVLLTRIDGDQLTFESLMEDPFDGNSPINYAPTVAEFGNVFRGDFNNDGILDHYKSGLDVAFNVNTDSLVFYGKRGQNDLLASVTDGFGKKVVFEYSTLTSDLHEGRPLFTPILSAVTAPFERVNRSMVVVKSFSVTDHADHTGFNTINYYYEGGLVDKRGRGFLGFNRIISDNLALKQTTNTLFRTDFPYTGLWLNREIRGENNRIINIDTAAYEMHPDNDSFIVLKETLQRKYGLSSASGSDDAVFVTHTQNEFDRLGNLVNQTVTTGSGFTTGVGVTRVDREVEVANEYNSDESNWLIGFLEKSTTTYRSDGDEKVVLNTFQQKSGTLDAVVSHYFDEEGEDSNITRSRFVYRISNGEIGFDRTWFSEDESLIPSAKGAKDNYGNSNFQEGIYPTRVTNQIGHSTELEYDYRFGLVNKETDPNGVPALIRYDEFGRQHQLIRYRSNSHSKKFWFFCDEPVPHARLACPRGAAYGEITYTRGEPGVFKDPVQVTFFNTHQREIRSQTYEFNGDIVKVDKTYYANGYLKAVSEPFKGNEADYWQTYENYDSLGRERLVNEPDGTQIVREYGHSTSLAGNTGSWVRLRETTNVLTSDGYQEQVKTTYTNSLGEVSRVVDAKNTPVDYKYDPQGFLRETIVDNNPDTKIVVEHDIAGNKIYIDDPSAGTIRFSYDGDGNIRKQTWEPGTANEKSMVFAYDALGRKTTRIDTAKDGSEKTYTWQWDTRKNGLLSTKSGDGYSKQFFYDHLARLNKVVEQHGGYASKEFTQTYGNFDKIKSFTSPSGVKINNIYHATGTLVQMQRDNGADGKKMIWAVSDNTDDSGRFIYETYGNGIATRSEYDGRNGYTTKIVTGDIASNPFGVQGSLQNLAYEYDSIGNLWQRSSVRPEEGEDLHESFEYDELNRLTKSTTIGLGVVPREVDYGYDDLGNLTSKSDVGTGQLVYDMRNGASVHAIALANGKRYHYDTYGNMIRRGDETLEYDVFNKPTRIDDIVFTYGPDHELLSKERGGVTTHFYNDGDFEIVNIPPYGEFITKTSVGGFYRSDKFFNGHENEVYLHRDHLGSIDAISDSTGLPYQRLAFDPWGDRRNSNWTTGSPGSGAFSDFAFTTEGFTGHEHIGEVNLIHMGGRVYDPVVGRFLSADVYIQAPYNSQSFNRYSYAFNNPLSYIDPTGYESCTAEACEEVIVTGTREEPFDNSSFVDFLNDFQRQTQDLAIESLGFGVASGVVYVGTEVLIQGFAIEIAGAIDDIRNGDLAGAAVNAVVGIFKPAKLIKLGRRKTRNALDNKKPDCRLSCFVAGTTVLSANGHVPIEELKVGDLVWAHDPDTGETALKPITRTYVNENDTVWDLTFKDERGETYTHEVTGSHPYYVVNSGWVEVSSLAVGDTLLLKSGETAAVLALINTGIVEITYNLEVKDIHTYYVSAAEVLVHNCNGAKRRTQNADDMTVSSERAARRQAFRENNVPTSKANNFTRQKVHGRNSNLKGQKGEPSEVVKTKDVNGRVVEIQHHSNGHRFEDTNEFELPHYHGQSTNHISY